MIAGKLIEPEIACVLAIALSLQFARVHKLSECALD